MYIILATATCSLWCHAYHNSKPVCTKLLQLAKPALFICTPQTTSVRQASRQFNIPSTLPYMRTHRKIK